MGHWHIASKDVEANKKLFLAMGGKLYTPGGNPLIMFPGVLINLNLGNEKGEGGTQGSVVSHVGLIVNKVQQRVAQWKAAGVRVLPGNNNRLDQAFVETPDGVRIEILEDKTQSMPVRSEHVHCGPAWTASCLPGFRYELRPASRRRPGPTDCCCPGAPARRRPSTARLAAGPYLLLTQHGLPQ